MHFLLGSHTVYAQKVLLVTYSDYFYRYFDLAPIKTEITRPSSIPICDYSYQVFRGYIHFIYTGALYETSALKEKWSEGEVIKYLVELTELALVYEETDLYELCLQELTSPDSSLMCPQLVTQIYSEAYRYHVAPLMEQCTKFMKTQPNVEMGLRSAENKATEQGNSELANDTSTRAPNEPTNGQRPTAISDTEGTPK